MFKSMDGKHGEMSHPPVPFQDALVGNCQIPSRSFSLVETSNSYTSNSTFLTLYSYSNSRRQETLPYAITIFSARSQITPRQFLSPGLSWWTTSSLMQRTVISAAAGVGREAGAQDKPTCTLGLSRPGHLLLSRSLAPQYKHVQLRTSSPPSRNEQLKGQTYLS